MSAVTELQTSKKTKDLYDIGEAPPLGHVPKNMHAWLIRSERFGDPMQAFQQEVVEVPPIKDDEVLVYVMAAGVNYNNVWAGLGIPIDVIKIRNKAGEPEKFHIGGSDASGIVYAVGKDVTNVKVGDEVVVHCATWDRDCPMVKAGEDPMYSPTFRIWGYETNYGSFAQFTKVQGHQCAPKPKHMTWEEAAAYMLVGATAYRMLHGWKEHTVRPDDLVLIWGGAGGLGSMAIQIVKAAGGIPIAVVAGKDKFDFCKQLGAVGCIDRRDFDHWGMLPHWKDSAGYKQWLDGARSFGKAIWDVLGDKRSPRIVFEHPGETTIPTSIFVCDTGGMVVICAGTTGYNATVDLRYLWMRQKRLEGSHFANDEQCYGLNDLAVAGKLDPCLSRTFPWAELPDSHQLMHENRHPSGNMSILVGAPEMGLGASSAEPIPMAHPVVPGPDLDRPRAAFPISQPLPGVAEQDSDIDIQPFEDDGSTVGQLMHPGVISCTRQTTLGEVANIMAENDVHAIVVIEDNQAVGVVSQTDMVLARQGRSLEHARAMTAGAVMSRGCVTVDKDSKVSEAVTTMTRMSIHRMVVTETKDGKAVPVGVLSMTDIVKRMVAG